MIKENASDFFKSFQAGTNFIIGGLPKKDYSNFIIDYAEEGKEKSLKNAEIRLDGKVIIKNLKEDTPYILRMFEKLKDEPILLNQQTILTKKSPVYKKIIESKNCALECEIKFQKLKRSKLRQRVRALEVNFLNILIVGRIGAGKSNFISTLQSIIKREYDNIIAPHGAAGKSYTSTLKKLKLEGIDQVNLIDLYGIQGENYKYVVKPLLEGTLPDPHVETKEPLPDYGLGTLQSRVHAVIFVVDSTMNQTDQTELDEILEVFKKIQGDPYKLQPILVLTKADTLNSEDEPSIKSHELFNNHHVFEATEFFENLFHCESYPFINYTSDIGRDYAIEYLGLHILHRAITLANDYIINLDKNIELRTMKNEILPTIKISSTEKLTLSDIRTKITKVIKGNFNYLGKDEKEIKIEDEDVKKVFMVLDKHETDVNVQILRIVPEDKAMNYLREFQRKIIPQNYNTVHFSDTSNFESSIMLFLDGLDSTETISNIRTKLRKDPSMPTSFEFYNNQNEKITQDKEFTTTISECIHQYEASYYVRLHTEKLKVKVITKSDEKELAANPDWSLSDIRMILESGLHKTKIKNFKIKVKESYLDRPVSLESKLKLGTLKPADADYLYLKLVEE